MNSRTTAFLCNGCGQRGNAITFLAWHKSLPETVARRLLEERYGGGGISAGVGTLEEEVLRIMNPEKIVEQERIPPSESWLEAFRVGWDGIRYIHPGMDYMYDRGFGIDILESWEIGYDQISDRITIPIWDTDGNLVGFKGRAWRENTIPKYMILGDYNNQARYGFQPYRKSHYVYGLDPQHRSSKTFNYVLVEGELNVLAMAQHGYYAAGIAGSEFSEKQCEIIRQRCNEVTIYLDNDKAGEKGTKKVIEMLSPHMPIKVVQNAPGDAAELDTHTIRELMSSAEPLLLLQAQGKI
jgi:5S rRNA maturation endonuclease (ribonuclease M5)